MPSHTVTCGVLHASITHVVDDDFSQRPERPTGFDVYPSGYGSLFDRVVDVSYADVRVRGMWLHGAFARGVADSASDLDVDIAVTDESFEEFTGAWREWLAAITATVSAVPLAPGSFYALTPGCERLDVISEKVSALPRSSLTRRIPIFDRDNLSARPTSKRSRSVTTGYSASSRSRRST